MRPTVRSRFSIETSAQWPETKDKSARINGGGGLFEWDLRSEKNPIKIDYYTFFHCEREQEHCSKTPLTIAQCCVENLKKTASEIFFT